MTSIIKFRSAFFGVAAVAFLLPFFTVSCGNVDVASVNGITFVTGGDVKIELMDSMNDWNSSDSNKDEARAVEPNAFAISAAALAILGLAFGFWQERTGYILSIVLGAAGIIALLLLRLDFDIGDEAKQDPQAAGLIKIKMKIGYLLALAGFAGGAIVGFLASRKNSTQAAAGSGQILDSDETIVS